MQERFQTSVTIGEESKVVTIISDDQGDWIEVDGQRRSLTLRERSSSKHQELLVDGERLNFGVQRTQSGFDIVIDGSVYEAGVADPRAAKYASLVKPPAGANREEIKAPMPGLVVSVLVKVGDEVAKGQTVLTLNAMKLENDIRCTKGGRVSEVFAEPEMAVEKGTKLLVIE
ncbi:MAG: biotin/lipoyl-binding protein [Planctomycetes bacterium]|nr:biotin/lipoyl-binding protein [Planctomycetota bacterium]